jgi:dihydroneopterin aldolase
MMLAMLRDSLFIRDLGVTCVIGIYPEERLSEQPVHLDLRASLDLCEAGRRGDLQATCDYDRLSLEIAALLRFRQYKMVETAAEEIAAMCLGVHPNLDSIELTLTKPHALRGRASGAGVMLQRNRSDYPRRREVSDFGNVEVLLETQEAGLYLLHIAPHHEIVPHRHAKMRELEWLVGGEVLRNGQLLQAWDPREWPLHSVHAYQNRSNAIATIFCCDTPPFDRSDEIPVDSNHRARR